VAEPHPPRADEMDSTLPASATCPFCDGVETHLINPFGGQLSVAQYWCRSCRTAFEYIKWEDNEGTGSRE